MVTSWHVLAVRKRRCRASHGPETPSTVVDGCREPRVHQKVAAFGFNLLLDQFASVDEIDAHIALFKAEVEASGRTFDPMADAELFANLLVSFRTTMPLVVVAHANSGRRDDRFFHPEFLRQAMAQTILRAVSA